MAMRLSRRGEYGLWALFDLAQHYDNGLIQSDTIAARQGIPVKYLDQMLMLLRQAGLVYSVRGPQGGHRLAHPPQQITILAAIIALEGPVMPLDAGRDDLVPTQPADREVIRGFLDTIRTTIEHLCKETTLEDLCYRKPQHSEYLMYHI